ncbi:CBS domain-containing protein [Methanonatronarchaeum sp. AMET6-2]|uniref:CBS domain-containing protein n=1 Tax=Methanonatronarchaeum sp. AMET6-2 TaxID=2933293 RepID=UPI0012247839|nr:CBS domain-containing protein [Methanonatronarchaeum sp. AMET6-2]RZN61984.1 MAG: CBS domain-containing protein [Methanonatronarchaeia archaeon]UOY09486.1 CBS domain-containing protein [Methanonatronarchaeum sp. AMET6-2]
MNVSEVMDKSPLYVRESDFITKARQVLRDNRLRALPVIDDTDKISGVLTRDGVLRVTSNKSNVTVKGFTENIRLVNPEDKIEEAGEVLTESGVDLVPVAKSKSNRTLEGAVSIQRVLDSISENPLNPDIKVRDIMSEKVETVPHNEKVSKCWLKMLDTGLSGFPVTKNGRLIGIITKGDVIQAGHARFSQGKNNSGGSRDKTKITRLMSTPVTKATPETPVAEAVSLMKKNKIGRLPVIEDEEIIGIVDRFDVLKPYLG